MKNRRELLWGAAGSLALMSLGATLYLSGVAYHAGYLREWRLPRGLVPLSYQETLEQGGYALMMLGASTLWFLFVTALGGLVVLQVYAGVKRKKSAAIDREIEPAAEAFYGLATGFLASVAALIALLMLLKFSVAAGADLAMGEANCADTALEPVPAGCEQAEFGLANKREKVVGRLIRCTERHCIVQLHRSIRVLRLEDIEEINIPTDGSSVALSHSLLP